MVDSSDINLRAGKRSCATSSSDKLWIISGNSELIERIGELLRSVTEQIVPIAPQSINKKILRNRKPDTPALVVLDINRDADWGLTIIQRLKRAYRHVPVVVLTRDFSRDFGKKIISEGVRYYFSYDFCTEEFLKVAEIFLKKKASSS